MLPGHPDRRFFGLVAAIAVIALAGVLVGQYGFGLQPCELCLLQRLPYGAVVVVALAMLALPTSARLRGLATGLVAVAFVIGTGLASYHVGVENHWWASAVCHASGSLKISPADLAAALTQRAPPPPCDQVQWTLFGITLAGYNAVLSLILALYSLGVLRVGVWRQSLKVKA